MALNFLKNQIIKRNIAIRSFLMKRKNLEKITILSILLSFLFTGGIFAYWANTVVGDNENTNPQINIGIGESVQTNLSLLEAQRTQGSLVPVGYEALGSVSEIVITYEVYLEATDEGSLGAVATLETVVGTLASPLLNVNVTQSNSQIVAGGNMVEIYVSVTLDEPANIDEYESVANLTFDIPLNFTATII